MIPVENRLSIWLPEDYPREQLEAVLINNGARFPMVALVEGSWNLAGWGPAGMVEYLRGKQQELGIRVESLEEVRLQQEPA